MASPVVPADFTNVIIAPTATFCLAFIRLFLRLPVLVSQLVGWMLTTAGNPSNEFLRAIFGSGHIKFGHVPSWQSTYWLPCDGQEYDSDDYPELAAVIGTIYGSATGGKFRTPDLRGRAPVGTGVLTYADATTGQTYSTAQKVGTETHALLRTELPDKPPTLEDASYKLFTRTSGGSGASIGGSGPWQAHDSGETFNSEDNAIAHENRGPRLALTAWIKT